MGTRQDLNVNVVCSALQASVKWCLPAWNAYINIIILKFAGGGGVHQPLSRIHTKIMIHSCPVHFLCPSHFNVSSFEVFVFLLTILQFQGFTQFSCNGAAFLQNKYSSRSTSINSTSSQYLNREFYHVLSPQSLYFSNVQKIRIKFILWEQISIGVGIVQSRGEGLLLLLFGIIGVSFFFRIFTPFTLFLFFFYFLVLFVNSYSSLFFFDNIISDLLVHENPSPQLAPSCQTGAADTFYTRISALQFLDIIGQRALTMVSKCHHETRNR